MRVDLLPLHQALIEVGHEPAHGGLGQVPHREHDGRAGVDHEIRDQDAGLLHEGLIGVITTEDVDVIGGGLAILPETQTPPDVERIEHDDLLAGVQDALDHNPGAVALA